MTAQSARPKVTPLDDDTNAEDIPLQGCGGGLVRFVDAVDHRHRLLAARVPETWSRMEVRCPACGRIFVATVSPREDAYEGRQAARRCLIRSCPNHDKTFSV
jgi:hypothetical protein